MGKSHDDTCQHRNTAVAEEVNESQANSTIVTKTVMFKLIPEEQTLGLQNSFALIWPSSSVLSTFIWFLLDKLTNKVLKITMDTKISDTLNKTTKYELHQSEFD